MGEMKRGITAEDVWTLMAAKMYNDDMIETQRATFNGASLEAGEDVSGLAKRLYELVLGLPELQGSSRSILLMQRLKYSLPSELRTHMATIRNTHSFDAAAAVLSQIQREKRIEGGRGRRREPVREVTEGQIDNIAATMPEIVQAIKTLVPTVSQQQHPSRATLSVAIDKSAPVGSRNIPVGPDPERPEDRNVACSSCQCYRCNLYGHIKYNTEGMVHCKRPRKKFGASTARNEVETGVSDSPSQ
jgi:hypothetical protein